MRATQGAGTEVASADSYPAIYEMQVRAILAATKRLKEEGLDPRPEIMMPLVMGKAELVSLRTRLEQVASEDGTLADKGHSLRGRRSS